MTDSRPHAIDPAALPEAVTRYLDAHRARDTATALATFAPDATVVDDGRTYEGTEAIEEWMNRSSAEFTYTTRLMGAEQTGSARFTAAQRVEGDFPGGVVDLNFRFQLRGGSIGRLVIEP